MFYRHITPQRIAAFRDFLTAEERCPATIEKYLRDVRSLSNFLNGHTVTKERASAWKESLARDYAPASVNAMVAAVNKFLTFQGWNDCRLKPLRLQRRLFREDRRELTKAEYDCLLQTA